MHISVAVQSMNLPDDIRTRIEAQSSELAERVPFEFDAIPLKFIGARCPRDNRGMPGNNVEFEILVPDIDCGYELPDWMSGVPHHVEITETTNQFVNCGRYRFGCARGEVTSYTVGGGAGYNPSTAETKIRVIAEGKRAYKQAVCLYGKIRTHELVVKYRQNVLADKRDLNVVELWD